LVWRGADEGFGSDGFLRVLEESGREGFEKRRGMVRGSASS